jgi:hypothetical protein
MPEEFGHGSRAAYAGHCLRAECPHTAPEARSGSVCGPAMIRWPTVAPESLSDGGILLLDSLLDRSRRMSLVACPDCSNQISDSAPACIHCGRPMGGRSPEYFSGSKEIKPLSPPRDPGTMAFLSLILPGLGQILVGQVTKGFAVLGGSVVLGALTALAAMLVIWPIVCVDAYLVARKLARGEAVAQWEWFPR